MIISNTEPSTHSSFLHSYKNTQGQLVKSTNNLWMRLPSTERISAFVDSLLQPIMKEQQSYIKDTTSLKEREFHKMQSLSQWMLQAYIQIHV